MERLSFFDLPGLRTGHAQNAEAGTGCTVVICEEGAVAGVDVRGNATRARIVLFRKPIERRAKDTAELADLLHEVLVAQVATYLGVEPSVIDPTIDDE